MKLEGGHDEPALRRVYPHFVRSRVKTKTVSVGGVGVVRLAARRVAWIESQDFVKKWGVGKWWNSQGDIQRGARDCWGLTPEVEFIILHGLKEQCQASPYTALKGVGGRELIHIRYIGDEKDEEEGGGGYVRGDKIVVSFPTEEEGKVTAAEWKQERRRRGS